MARRLGRFTKQETADLIKLYEEGYSVYRICRAINRSQNSIRNNLIRLGKMKGEVITRKYFVQNKDEVLDWKSELFDYLRYFCFLIFLILIMLVNSKINPIIILIGYIHLIFKI